MSPISVNGVDGIAPLGEGVIITGGESNPINIGGEINGNPEFEGDGFVINNNEPTAEELETAKKEAQTKYKQAVNDEKTAKAKVQAAQQRRAKIHQEFQKEKEKVRELQAEVKKLQADLEAANAGGDKKKCRSILSMIKSKNTKISSKMTNIQGIIARHRTASTEVVQALTTLNIARNYTQETHRAYEASKKAVTEATGKRFRGKRSYVSNQSRSTIKPTEQKLDRLVTQAGANQAEVEQIATTAEEAAATQRGINVTGNAAERAVQTAEEASQASQEAVAVAQHETQVVRDVVQEAKPMLNESKPAAQAAREVAERIGTQAENVVRESEPLVKKASGNKWKAIAAVVTIAVTAITTGIAAYSGNRRETVADAMENEALKKTVPEVKTEAKDAAAEEESNPTDVILATNPETGSEVEAEVNEDKTEQEDVAEIVDETEVVTTEELEAEAEELAQSNIYTVKDGDCVWNIAKDLLEDPDQDGVKDRTDVGGPEIARKVAELMGLNKNLHYEEDGKHVKIYTGDKIKY